MSEFRVRGAEANYQAQRALRLTQGDIEVEKLRAEVVAQLKLSDGLALCYRARQTSGSEAAKLLAQAVATYRSSLAVTPMDKLPRTWARIEDALGDALENQSNRVERSESQDLLAQAVSAYRNALEVQTREGELPEKARTEKVLGDALLQRCAQRTGGSGQRSKARRISE